MAEYRDTESALSAQITTLEDELKAIELRLARVEEKLEAARAEQDALEEALSNAIAPPRAGPLERTLYVALMVPAAGGLGSLVALAIGSVLLGLPFGQPGFNATFFVCSPVGLGAALWTLRRLAPRRKTK